ncbi:MAG: type II pantothenate kinase [Clostridiales bacterium]|jgi:type II pantothenate kinase|nr:type II pantothenate kinase [Clostridiales bacterium]
MKTTIGIDLGGSTTKIVGITAGEIISPLLVRATDPVASLFGAFGKFVDQNHIALSDIKKIMITGVGASYIGRPIYGLPTGHTPEFLANGLGGLHLSQATSGIIVSMGTGTALVKATPDKIEHIGGTGIGGGTILGLASRMINIRDIDLIIKLAEEGTLSNVDLMVGDITKNALPNLLPETTASNFGRISDVATKSDLALGILNMVFQSIGTMAAFALKNSGLNDAVLIGNLTALPQCRTLLVPLSKLFGVNYILPKNSEYATAVGAALAYELDAL